MRDALIFAGLVLSGVAVIFQTPDAAPSPRPPAQLPAQDISAPLPVPSGPAVELPRAGNGHFYAPVTIGGHAVTMLVDTGASVVALTGEDARRAGIAWNTADLAVVAQGAGGAIRGVRATVPVLRLGAHEARDVSAVVIPEGLPVSLLGQSFLRTIEPVRIEKDVMVLGR